MPTLGGKNVYLTGDDPPSSYDELWAILREVNVRDGLRALGEAFCAVDEESQMVAIQDVPIAGFAIPPLALELVHASNDAVSGQMDETMLVRAMKLFHAIRWPDPGKTDPAVTLLRMGQSQFSFQRNDPYRLARIVDVFVNLWPKVRETKGLSPNEAALASFGVGLEETLIFGSAFYGQARRGYVTVYGEGDEGDEKHKVQTIFKKGAQKKFLEALSTTYEELRSKDDLTLVEPKLRKFRFNPLVIAPLISPDTPPPNVKDDVFLVPCRKFLLDRITDGLVFDCRRKYGKAFNDAFGYVVERYVGEMLEDVLGAASVRRQFSYRVGKRRWKSPDWLVVRGGRGVVFEVKKSLLGPRSRAFADLETVRQDLKSTLGHGREQLTRFQRHLPHLKDLPSRENVELVVVSWEPSWWNAILSELVAGNEAGPHVHVVSVHDLERLVDLAESADGLYDMLWTKRNGDEAGRNMDMADWLARLPGGDSFRANKRLERVHREFFARWDMPSEDP